MLKEISIEIIRKCPNRCLHCSSLSSEACKEMIPFEKFKEVVDSGKKLGLQTVCFSGGEPFLHPDLAKMTAYVSDSGLRSYVYSSGIYMDAKKNRAPVPTELLDKLAGKVTKIIYNIEAVDEAVYDTIMGTKGCFSFLKQSIRRSVDRNIEVEGHFVPMKLNKDQIEPVVDFCQRSGISKISFLRLVIHGRAQKHKEQLLLLKEEQEDVASRLMKLYQTRSSYIRIGVPLFGETAETHCEAASGKLNIRYDGNVYPCEVFKNHRMDILEDIAPGNIFMETLEHIYQESAYLKQVRMLIDRFSCSSCCENCVGQYYINRKKQGENSGEQRSAVD